MKISTISNDGSNSDTNIYTKLDINHKNKDLTGDLNKELNRDQNFAKNYFGITIDTSILKPALTDFRRVVLPSFITKIFGRLLWLNHIISPNILSSAFIISNVIAGAYISAISSSLEFLLRLWELKGSKDKNCNEKLWSAASIALKTAVKFYCVYMSWVLGTVAMTALGVMAGPHLALGMLGVGAATSLGIGLATVLTEVIPVLWKPLFKQYAIEFMKNCKIEASDKKKVEIFFEKVCEKYFEYTQNCKLKEIEPKTLDELLLIILENKNNSEHLKIFEEQMRNIEKMDFRNSYEKLNELLKEKGFDLTNTNDLDELNKTILQKGKLDFSPVYKSFLRGFCEGLCWSYLEHFLNEKNLKKIADAVIVSVVVSTSFLVGGCLDSIWWRKDLSNYFRWDRKQKEVTRQVEPIKQRLNNIIEKKYGDITPDEVMQVFRLSNRINNTKFKNKVLKWIKQIVALKNIEYSIIDSNNNSNPQSPTLIQENNKSAIKWYQIKEIVDKPRPKYGFSILFCKTNTSKMHSLENTEGKNVLKNSLKETQASILSITKISQLNKNITTPMAYGLADDPLI